LINLENKVLRYIKEHDLLNKHDKPLIAVSGGIDSIVLLNIINNLSSILKYKKPIVAHLNHQLRGAEADRDQRFVKKIVEDLGLVFESKSIPLRQIAKREKGSIQELARKYRLEYLDIVCEKHGCTKILTGHNRDDLSETSLMWITRGTGIKGAIGIQPKRGIFVRPLLCCTRQDIVNYASPNGIIHVEDSSNSKLDYVRNQIRHEVLPLIEKTCYPTAKENIARFADLLRMDNDYIEQSIKEKFHVLTQNIEDSDGLSIDITELVSLHPAIKTRMLRYMINEISGTLKDLTQKHIEQILDVCMKKEGGRKHIHLPGNVEAVRTYNKLIIKPTEEIIPFSDEEFNPKGQTTEYLLNYPGTTDIDDWGLRIDLNLLPGGKAIENYKFNDPYLTFVNFESLDFPLRVRLPQKGDRFIPLGSKGTKKLSDFFIDTKVPADRRWKTPLLVDKENIVWVIGYRINEPYRIRYDSKNVLMIKASWI
jgi:tRNA(Ile)-lysidine synthase